MWSKPQKRSCSAFCFLQLQFLKLTPCWVDLLEESLVVQPKHNFFDHVLYCMPRHSFGDRNWGSFGIGSQVHLLDQKTIIFFYFNNERTYLYKRTLLKRMEILELLPRLPQLLMEVQSPSFFAKPEGLHEKFQSQKVQLSSSLFFSLFQ